MWTQFWDMHSGGGQKLDWPMIYIEAPEEEAKSVFYSRFDRNPERTTCTCCGGDYSISESETLEQATAYHRNCKYVYRNAKGEEVPEREGFVIGRGKPEGYTSGYEEIPSDKSYMGNYIPLKDYIKTVKVIYAKDIKPEERTVDVPEEGYVWQD